MAVSENSFEMISKNVGMFRHSTNIGVVFNNEEIFLIDSGPAESDGKNVVDTLQKLFPQKKIKTIIQTHSHADHCSGASIIKKMTNASVWASNESAKIMEVPNLVASIYCGGNPLKELLIPEFTLPKPVIIDRIVGEEKVQLDKVDLEFYFLPGHFFDQIGILVLDKEDSKKVFFLGDSFFGIELLKRTWIPFMCDQKEFRKSVRKIENIKSDFYIPAHGSSCTKETITAYAEINIMVTYEFESLILKKIDEGFCTLEELLKAVANYSSIKLKIIPYFLIRTTLQSYLSCMEQEGVLDCEIIENKLIWKKAK